MISARQCFAEGACGAAASWMVNEDHADEALGGAPLRVAHVLDLLGDLRDVEIVRQVAPVLRKAAQGSRLMLQPCVVVLVVQRAPVHGPTLAQNARLAKRLPPGSGSNTLSGHAHGKDR